jgi:hypothetical protein
MESAAKGAGQLLGTLGYRAQLLVIGVLLPGLLITLELSAVWAFNDEGRRNAILALLPKDAESLAVPGIGVVLLIFFPAYILGYVAREMTFKCSTAWLRRGWPPARRASVILAQLRTVHGAGQVDQVIRHYPVFDLASREADPATLALPRPADFYIREFCKLWLRTKAPALRTDGMEAEINMGLGFVIPSFLGVIPSVVFIPAMFGPAVAAGAVIGFILIGSGLFYNTNTVRCQETEEAISSFLFAHRMRLDRPSPDSPPRLAAPRRSKA